MDMGFGGPVWHASVMAANRTQAEAMAENALEGVGDATLGEWREYHKAFHIRRRLSHDEQKKFGLRMIDLRNTDEGNLRLFKLGQQFPWLCALAMQELAA